MNSFEIPAKSELFKYLFKQDADMWICPASPLSTRRYDFIEFENGKVLGEKKYCGLGTTKVSETKEMKVDKIKIQPNFR